MIEAGLGEPEVEADLGKIPLFAHLRRDQIDRLRPHLKFSFYEAGELLAAEGQESRHCIFIIIEGVVSLCKKAPHDANGSGLPIEFETRGKFDIFGGMSALDGRPLSVSAIAKTPVTLAAIDLSRHSADALQRSTRNVLIAELRRYMANYVRASLDYRIDSLLKEAEFAHYRSAVGSIVIAALSLLSFYTLSLSVLPRFESYLEVNFALSPFIIMFFAAIFYPVIHWSGFPAAFFGIRFDNWRGAVLFSFGASLAFIAAGAFLKWMIIAGSPSLKDMTVFSWADVSVDGKEVMASPWYWFAVTLYMLLTPVQEFVARCGIQAPLYAFLQGSELKRRGLAIVVSNLVFSAAHTHIGLIFALATFIPGLFWGWIFARTNSLLAVSVSHLLIGGAGIFLFGIEEFVQKLF
jgi:CRP-like cAMP-binding protein/membrane protease YdiL (CAAX protease family)